eukprot:TRINITY_DN3857_c0_g1_i1.p2 TRINITY_DN3857_c0_g1~~TRINITY_DN3857_c0_g1_i1.p2  ORF type:complete len:263 (-),score=68.89 TRINITY_DN3857_c0_g1_i1:65-853(-)
MGTRARQHHTPRWRMAAATTKPTCWLVRIHASPLFSVRCGHCRCLFVRAISRVDVSTRSDRSLGAVETEVGMLEGNVEFLQQKLLEVMGQVRELRKTAEAAEERARSAEERMDALEALVREQLIRSTHPLPAAPAATSPSAPSAPSAPSTAPAVTPPAAAAASMVGPITTSSTSPLLEFSPARKVSVPELSASTHLPAARSRAGLRASDAGEGGVADDDESDAEMDGVIPSGAGHSINDPSEFSMQNVTAHVRPVQLSARRR